MSIMGALGFIGLGAMGTPMAHRLLAGDRKLIVWNRSLNKMAGPCADGARAGESPASVAESSEVTFLSLTDTAAVEEVVFGRDGVRDAAAPGKILVDTSSIDPEATRGMAARLQAETGMHWVDAPVSGGTAGAQAGNLVVMAGGEAEDVAAIRPAVEHFAQRLTHMGPNGAGQTTKVCNQMIVGGTIAIVAETLKLAADAGIAAALLPDCLAGGFADSTILQVHARRMIAADLAPRGGVRLMLKDMDTALGVARATGTAVPMTALAGQLFRLLVASGHSDVDQGGLIRLYAEGPL
jgi:3-hydroxyisobutyrate dehydrogenase